MNTREKSDALLTLLVSVQLRGAERSPRWERVPAARTPRGLQTGPWLSSEKHWILVSLPRSWVSLAFLILVLGMFR